MSDDTAGHTGPDELYWTPTEIPWSFNVKVEDLPGMAQATTLERLRMR